MDKNGVVRKDTKGVPRITEAVVAMTPEQREVWFKEKTANLSPAQTTEIRSRLDALNAGKYELKGQGQGKKGFKSPDLSSASLEDLDTLIAACTAMKEEIRVKMISEIAAQEKELAERKAALGMSVVA